MRWRRGSNEHGESRLDARHYDVIVAPVITEKATVASEQTR